MSVRFSWNSNIEERLARGQMRAAQYLTKTTVYYSLQAETRAKRSAKWTDRTGNARNGLVGSYEVSRGGAGSTYAIELSYSVNYGIFLETRNFSRRGKLAVVEPTLKEMAPRFQRAAANVLQRIFG
jgi:hypothetical protein